MVTADAGGKSCPVQGGSLPQTNRQALETVFKGKVPDHVPHFELVFQLTKEAFGLEWPDHEDMQSSSPVERDRHRGIFFEIWERIIDRYGWAAVQMPTSLCGAYTGEVVKEGRKRFGSRAMIFDFNGEGTFWMPNGEEMSDFYALFYDAPEEAHALARQKCEASKEFARRQAAEGVEFIVINSDYGYNAGPFLSPAMFDEFVTPYLAEIVDEIHRQGIPAILHSDGNLREILPSIVSTGIDGYQSIDPQGGMDLADVKQRYGDKLILMGNVRTALLQEPDDLAIRTAVRDCIRIGAPGGRYVFSTSNCIFKGMPLESYGILHDEYLKRR
jgi:uroporphyrinogen decarboxylase